MLEESSLFSIAMPSEVRFCILYYHLCTNLHIVGGPGSNGFSQGK